MGHELKAQSCKSKNMELAKISDCVEFFRIQQ